MTGLRASAPPQAGDQAYDAARYPDAAGSAMRDHVLQSEQLQQAAL